MHVEFLAYAGNAGSLSPAWFQPVFCHLKLYLSRSIRLALWESRQLY